jgi:hypothetical protein
MIVDLAIYGKNQLLVWGEKRLPAGLWIHDAQSFVSKYGRSAAIDSAPVWSTMPDFLAHSESLLSKLIGLLPDVEDGNDSTHDLVDSLSSLISADIACRC